MKIDQTIRAVAIATASGVLIALSLSGVAKAITDTVFRYSTPKTGYLSLDATGFAPLTNSAADAFTIYYVYDGLIATTAGGSCFGTSVNLPQGARMTALAVWFQKGAQVSLVRHKPSDGTATMIANKTFNSAQNQVKGGTVDITDTSLQLVDNQHYSYGLVACLPDAADYFFGARITYTYNNAGD